MTASEMHRGYQIVRGKTINGGFGWLAIHAARSGYLGPFATIDLARAAIDAEIWPVPYNELKYAGVEAHIARLQGEMDDVWKVITEEL